MKIEPNSLRFTNSTGEFTIVAPSADDYDSFIPFAQEKFDKVTRTWRRLDRDAPMFIEEGARYRVYLDGSIIPWFVRADRDRGFVDVWAELPAAFDKVRYIHRLFGIVTFVKMNN